MRNFIVILIVCSSFVMSGISHAEKVVLNLVDLSGSLTFSRPVFHRNMTYLNAEIDYLNKKDRFSILAFRSLGEPWQVVDYQLPKKQGGRNKIINKARNNLRKRIDKNFSNPPDLKQMGGGTDIIGGLFHSLIWIFDQGNIHKSEVIMNIYSYGIHTEGVGSLLHLKNLTPYSKRLNKMETYLIELEKKLSKVNLTSLPLKKVVWFGAISSNDLGLRTMDLAYFETRLRKIWQDFLSRTFPNTEVIYLTKY